MHIDALAIYGMESLSKSIGLQTEKKALNKLRIYN
jgi:hypothetical protein